ncbi:hypothetical protein SDRG_00973 [Saprolegnia diclina VS20]|uniref:Uncharacterized protein n=1 Tax=Saprolegnia diclina (strain VS20) TaxID=1156394 RepID=T0SA01_SAPDV|nr:hypothetical protein SDRG_00973 [Saprolegnia diclina VS20]EQC42133.1 hypothetical protein SDRG_00973 [Saprolegnia diclina VS20]|eukprot:XP_008604702.1 hypothetical protein SDRG_00973 [Saprolegnia diclina VS20]
MKAYISEPLPWMTNVRTDWTAECAVNTTACKERILMLGRNQSQHLRPGGAFAYGPAFDVTRQTVLLDPHSPTPLLLRMPLSQYFSVALRRDTMALDNGALAVNDFGSVLVSRFLRIPVAYTAFWAVNTTTGSVEMYGAMQLPLFTVAFGALKFGMRAVMTTYIVWLM